MSSNGASYHVAADVRKFYGSGVILAVGQIHIILLLPDTTCLTGAVGNIVYGNLKRTAVTSAMDMEGRT